MHLSTPGLSRGTALNEPGCRIGPQAFLCQSLIPSLPGASEDPCDLLPCAKELRKVFSGRYSILQRYSDGQPGQKPQHSPLQLLLFHSY